MPAVREKERLWVLMHTERQALTWLTVQQGSPLGFCWISVHAGFDGRYGCSVILWKFQPVGFLYSSWYSFSWELWLPASAGVPPPPPPPAFPAGRWWYWWCCCLLWFSFGLLWSSLLDALSAWCGGVCYLSAAAIALLHIIYLLLLLYT